MNAKLQPEIPADPAPSRRLKGGERVETILRAAAALFAREGLGGSTRQIATELGVTQALLYRFFASKEELIDRVYEAHFRDRWQDDWDRLLADDGLPLEERLVRFYTEYAAGAEADTVRLFVHAGLAGRPLPGARGARLTERIFAPVIGSLRRENGLPSLAHAPMLRGERELVMQLHSSIAFLGIRRHVYGMPMPADVSDIVALYVRIFVEGAPGALRVLHGERAEWPGLRVRQLRPPRRARRRPARD